jgi:hypothetical protein
MAQSSGTEGHSGGGTDRGRCPAWSRWNVRARNLVVRCAGQLAYGTSSQGERSDRPVGYRRSSAAAHGGWGRPVRTDGVDRRCTRARSATQAGAPPLRRAAARRSTPDRSAAPPGRAETSPPASVAARRAGRARAAIASRPAPSCRRSIMLFVIHGANHPDLACRGGQAPIVHMQGESRAAVLSTERHADHASSTRGCIGKLLSEDLCRAA